MRTYVAKFYTSEFGVVWPLTMRGSSTSAIAFRESIVALVESKGYIVIKFESVTEIL